MQDVKNIEPNWRIYCVLLTVFALLSLTFYGLLGFSLKGFLLFSTLPIISFTYLLFIQNKLELGSTNIVQHFLIPFRSSHTIKIDDIDWVALDTRKFSWSRYKLLARLSVIIKLKDSQVITIKLTLLNRKKEIQEFFLHLSSQMDDHETELLKLKDLHGFNQLAIDATLGLTNLVEAMHQNITRLPGMSELYQESPTPSVTASIYKGIRTITGLAGGGIDGLLAQITPLLGKNTLTKQTSPTDKQTNVSLERVALLSALNGVLGDYMSVTNNAMTIPMRLRRNGRLLKLSSESLFETIQPITGKLLVMVHGLCMNDLQWQRKGHDHGVSLSLELAYTPIYLRYNSGQHISTNGRAFSELLEMLVRIWPVPIEELAIIGHSMGGLITRSAYYYGEKAEHQWIKKTQKMVFLGSPHHGAPLERGGNWIDTILGSTPYTAPLARIGKVRSSGITDLRYGNIIDEHWQNRDRFERSHDTRTPVPLPKEVQCFTIAGTTGKKVGDVKDQLLGDGLVQVNSALGKHKDPNLNLDIPTKRKWIGYGINHMDLLNHSDVYTKIKQWLS
ncbi:MAG: pimeloyl-ACP methyl ester carboxylesterase [Pseudohongiellaceae bacterium]|jgi:pimeloyl-ACP methyl ester carboxylesterase